MGTKKDWSQRDEGHTKVYFSSFPVPVIPSLPPGTRNLRKKKPAPGCRCTRRESRLPMNTNFTKTTLGGPGESGHKRP